jgi:DNA topoisomerase VI subunit A
MTWSYRICKDDNGEHEATYSIREVFYNEDKKVMGFTEEPINVVAESPESVVNVLEMMLKDVKRSLEDIIEEKGFKFAPGLGLAEGEEENLEIPPEGED